MKFVVKQIVMAAAVLTIAVPAFAAETAGAPRMPTKGTKSYQTGRAQTTEDKTQTIADTSKPEDVQNIAPAAGATEDKADTGKSFKEEMRLPRKN